MNVAPVRRVLRYAVPADGAWHDLELAGPIVHVDTRSADVVELWADALVDESYRPVRATVRRFRVFGTGHPVPPEAHHVGTALAAGGALVWHLFETPVTR